MTQFAYDTEAEAADKIADAPEQVKIRIKGLENEAREINATRSARQNEINDLNDLIRDATQRLHAARKEESKNGPYHSEVIETDSVTGGETTSKKATGYVQKLERELAALVLTRRELLDRKLKPAHIEQVKEDLGTGAPRPLVPADPIVWQPNEGETITEGHAREFHALSALLKEEDALWNAPRSVAETEETALAEIDATAARGAPEFGGHHRGSSYGHRGRQVATSPRIGWPRERIGLDSTDASDGPAIIAWLLRDQLKAAASELIRSKYSDEGAISAADKPQLLADIAVKIWHQRRVVEAAYLACRAAGFTKVNRPRFVPTEILIDVLPWRKGLAIAVADDAPKMDDAPVDDEDADDDFGRDE